MAAKALINLDPNLDLPKAFEQIAAEQAAQTQGVQQFGAGQDKNIQSIYGQLGGSLQQGVGTVQSIYGNAGSNVQAAYDRAGTGAQAAASSNIGAIGNFAQSLGMDQRALSEVQGRLATQAQRFEERNRTSSAGAQSRLAQIGAGMASVAQLGVQAAKQAEAQNRTDLSRKITDQLARIQTAAASARTGFTAQKVAQTRQAAAEAQKGILQAAKELANEQRAAAREARADARTSARIAASRQSSGPDWLTKFQLQNEENDRRFQRGLESKGPDMNEVARQYDRKVREELGRGNAYEAFAAVVNGDMSWSEAQKEFKTPKGKKLNWDLIGQYVDEWPL